MKTIRDYIDLIESNEQGVAEGFFGIDDKIKGKIQNVVSDLSDIPGMWDHKAQTFTDAGMDKLKTVLKNNPKYIKYALNLDYRDYEAEGVAEGSDDTASATPAKNERGKFTAWDDDEPMRLECEDGEFRTIQEINMLRQKIGMKPFSIKEQGVAEGKGNGK